MMFSRLVTTLGLVAACLLAADDPFVGKWKLNPESSKLVGQSIRIEVLPDNKYVFTEDEASDEVMADGLDHLTHFGETMSVTQKSSASWSIVYKKDSQILMTTLWTLSADGQQLTYVANGRRPNGQQFNNQLTAKRIAGTTGLAGTWQSTTVKLSSPESFEVKPYGADGHTILFPATKSSISMRFNGKDYPQVGPSVPDGYVASGRRVDAHTLQVVDKIKGKVVERSSITVSADGKTQTFSVTEPGEKNPAILVYDRQP